MRQTRWSLRPKEDKSSKLHIIIWHGKLECLKEVCFKSSRLGYCCPWWSSLSRYDSLTRSVTLALSLSVVGMWHEKKRSRISFSLFLLFFFNFIIIGSLTRRSSFFDLIA